MIAPHDQLSSTMPVACVSTDRRAMADRSDRSCARSIAPSFSRRSHQNKPVTTTSNTPPADPRTASQGIFGNALLRSGLLSSASQRDSVLAAVTSTVLPGLVSGIA